MKKSVSERQPPPYRLPKISKSPLYLYSRNIRNKTNEENIQVQENNHINRIYTENASSGPQHTLGLKYERSESENVETGQGQQYCRVGKQKILEKKRVKRMSENDLGHKKSIRKHLNQKKRYQDKKENQSISKNNIYSSPIWRQQAPQNCNSSQSSKNMKYYPKRNLIYQSKPPINPSVKANFDRFLRKPSIEKRHASLNPRDTDDTSSLTSKNQHSEQSSFRNQENNSQAYSMRSKESNIPIKSYTTGREQEAMIQKQIQNLDLLYEKIKKYRCITKKQETQKLRRNIQHKDKDIKSEIVDHTLMNFERSIKKNREYIHNEIVKNLSMKKNKNTFSFKIDEERQKYDLSKSVTKQIKVSIPQPDPYSQRNSRPKQEDLKIARKNEDNRLLLNNVELSSKIESAKNQSNFDPQLFEQLSKIIVRRMTLNQQSSEITNQNRRHLNSIKFKQLEKITKLAKKCQHYSPTKSIEEIKEETHEELEKEYGVYPKEKLRQKNKKKSESSRKILKSEENYMEWRRYHLPTTSKHKLVTSNKKWSICESRNHFNQANKKNGIKTPALYKESSYEIENSKLSQFYLKTEINLEDYFQNKSEADQYRNQTPSLYRGRQ